MNSENSKKERAYTSQSEIPSFAIEDTLKIAKSLYDNFGGRNASAAPHQLAIAVGISPTSTNWQYITGAAIAYGLTVGGNKAQKITLAEIGKRIVGPLEEGDEEQAKIESVLKPGICRRFFEKYNRAKFPQENIAKNILEEMGVPKNKAENLLEIIKKNGYFAGIIQDTKTGPFVALDNIQNISSNDQGSEEEIPSQESLSSNTNESSSQDSSVRDTPQKNILKPIFIAHGKDKKPLGQLKKILDQFNIPYKVAVDEPNSGRPVSQKVRELMNECGSAIFIFSESGEASDGEEILPNINVVYELGAASVLYGDKIIIFKEEKVNFSSDFRDLCYISFESERLDAKAMDLLKELIQLGFVKIAPVN